MIEYVEELKKNILKNRLDKDKIAKLKIKLSKKYNLKKIPTDIEILMNLNNEDYEEMKKYLHSKPTRNLSGVQIVALMAKPSNCPHGRCIMCPGGLNSFFGDVPQSYTGNEPATMRAIRNSYDPYLQVFNRLEQYLLLGIYPQKIELILMGGTFLFLDDEYKEYFVTNIYKAMNDFSDLFYENNNEFNIEKFKKFFRLPRDKNNHKIELEIKNEILKIKELNISSLNEEKKRNDLISRVKCVGFTIETKPDYGRKKHGLEMLKYGCTRVELGVQTLYDKSLKFMNRGHDINDTINSIKELKDLGFKLNYHIMFGVPATSKKEEVDSFPIYFNDERFKPDMIKIYPLMVMPGTPLENLYKNGEFKPITTEEASEEISEFMKHIKKYCRIMRVQRDIPPKFSVGGVDRSNLRQYVEKKMNKKGIVSKDIRSKELGTHLKSNEILNKNEPKIKIMEYDASKGKEFFISLENENILFGFLRLRFPSESLSKEITKKSSIVRELHIYGNTVQISNQNLKTKDTKINENNKFIDDNEAQHKGYGKKLMKTAEEISKKFNKNKILVISGIGVRGYYRKLGYELEGVYMSKKI